MTISGIQKAQQDNLRRIVAMQPSGALGRMIQYATIEAHRYVVAITHVDTGSLRASHRLDVRGGRGSIYIDPNSVNPRSGARPAQYGPVEHARGGSHAFYERTEREAGQRIAQAAAAGLVRDMYLS